MTHHWLSPLRTGPHAVAGILLLAGAGVRGQENAVVPPANQPAAGLPRVEITGPARFESELTTNLLVVRRADIEKFGDGQIGDVLRRLPGVSLSGSGESAQVRLRGLGTGYTRILVNGEAAPPGFSAATLASELVERVEVSFSPNLEQGTAIAGTVNFILRKTAQATTAASFSASMSDVNGKPVVNLGGRASGGTEGFNYGMSAALIRTRRLARQNTTRVFADAGGQVTSEERTTTQSESASDDVSVAPQLTWKIGDNDTLVAKGFLRHFHYDRRDEESYTTVTGTPRSFVSGDLSVPIRSTLVRTTIEHTHAMADGARLNTSLVASSLWRESNSTLITRAADGAPVLTHLDDSDVTDRSAAVKAKYELPFGRDHSLVVGLEADNARRRESSLQSDAILGGEPVRTPGSFDAQVRKLAAYGQDEWTLSPAMSVYYGLRWERLSTSSLADGDQAATNDLAVFSPVLNALWKIPSSYKDQLRVSLSRAYKAPTPYELTPRVSRNIPNTAVTPDVRGNPQLRPEVAWSLDLSYSREWTKTASLGVTVYAKRIRDAIRSRLTQENGVWTSDRSNAGPARAWGVELETKFRARDFHPAALPFEFAANASVNRSRVLSVPGPDNVLEGQIPYRASLSVDYPATSHPLRSGFSLSVQGAASTQLAAGQFISTGRRSSLDAYTLWRLSESSSLRFAVVNLLRRNETSGALYRDAFQNVSQALTEQGARTIRIAYEARL